MKRRDPPEGRKRFVFTDNLLHSHLKARIEQRGVTREEIEATINEGWVAEDAKPGTFGRTMVFEFKAEWLEKHYEEKEVTVYYKETADGDIVILTVVARYGARFPRRHVS